VEERLTTRRIGTLYGYSKVSIAKWLRQAGVELRQGKGLAYRGQVRPDAETLRRLVHEEFLPLRAIGARFGVDMKTIRLWLIADGTSPAHGWTSRRRGVIPVPPDAETLRRLYVDAGMSIRAISRHSGISERPVAALLRRYGVPLRHDSGWDGGQRRVCADGHRVRSTYEQRVDDWLHEQGLPHVYEPVTPFDRRSHADFLANGWYVEVWGVTNDPAYTARRRRKVRRYREQGLALIEIGAHDFCAQARGRWTRQLAKCLQVPVITGTPA
jgi:hypothetical protein